MEEKSNRQILQEYLPLAALLLSIAAAVIAIIAFSASRQAQQAEARQEVVTWSDYRQLQNELKKLEQKIEQDGQKQNQEIYRQLQRLQRQINNDIDTRWQELEEMITSQQLAAEETDRQQQVQLDVLQQSVNSLSPAPDSSP